MGLMDRGPDRPIIPSMAFRSAPPCSPNPRTPYQEFDRSSASLRPL